MTITLTKHLFSDPTHKLINSSVNENTGLISTCTFNYNSILSSKNIFQPKYSRKKVNI